jgi:hypothetical protein
MLHALALFPPIGKQDRNHVTDISGPKKKRQFPALDMQLCLIPVEDGVRSSVGSTHLKEGITEIQSHGIGCFHVRQGTTPKSQEHSPKLSSQDTQMSP